MSDYCQDHIKLDDAMSEAINQKIRLWSTPGLQIESENVPKNVCISKTCVLKVFDLYYSLAVEIEGEKNPALHNVDDFSSLEELKLKFPHLFELDGNLFAFS